MKEHIFFLQVHHWSSSSWTTSCFVPHALSSTVQTPQPPQPLAMTSTPSRTYPSLHFILLHILTKTKRGNFNNHLSFVVCLGFLSKSPILMIYHLHCVCFVRCSTASSRLAAYEVLVMLADSSLSNLRLITRELLSMHHQSDPSLCKEFDVRAWIKVAFLQ